MKDFWAQFSSFYVAVGFITFFILLNSYEGCNRKAEEAWWGAVLWPVVAYEKTYGDYVHPCEGENR